MGQITAIIFAWCVCFALFEANLVYSLVLLPFGQAKVTIMAQKKHTFDGQNGLGKAIPTSGLVADQLHGNL